MAHMQTLDPSAPPLDHYGWELRRQREAHGLEESRLGEIIHCTGPLVGQIETTKSTRRSGLRNDRWRHAWPGSRPRAISVS